MKNDFTTMINDYLQLEIDTINKINIAEVNAVLNMIVETYENDGNIYIFGNGGSASTASHYTNDFNKGISEYTNKKFRFICLNDNISTIMAIANDIGYEEVFRFQLKGRIASKDLVIGISGSGNSANVVNAITYANECGVKTIGITGYDGGKTKQLVDLSLNVPINNMQITEDLHMIFDHLMMSVLYRAWNIKSH